MMRTRVLLLLALVVTLAVAVAAQDPHDLYQRALVEENARGDLKAAISLYEQAAHSAGRDRELAAQSLIHAAEAREKLGQRDDAARTYAEVIRAYPEQRTEAAVAQARLAALHVRNPAGASATPDSTREDLSSSTTPLFTQYCVPCHNPGTRSGGLDVAALNGDVGTNTAVWEEILARLRARRDPPLGSPRPDDAAYRGVVSRLERSLDAAYARNHTLSGAERVTDTELATRMAALIWSGPPDAALLNDARRGGLHDPDTLTRQTARMLRDPRSSALVSGFFTNWLSLKRIEAVHPDPAEYPQFDADLLRSMQTETRLFLESQLREDHDAIDVWTADYTYVNDRLARHYGVPGVSGPTFRRVKWPNAERAGILGEAGILAALSVPNRTSPTSRGRFILSRFLGIEAPNPPANVPALAEHPPTPGTMRDRLRTHKLVPSCASCHAMFDPLGLALENFDAIGAWRATDDGVAIDASGQLADGTRFDGPAQLRAALLKYRDAYYTNVTTRLLAYALRRDVAGGRVYDYEMPAVRAIVRDAARNHDRWSSILGGIVASAPFQMKQRVP